MKIQTQEDSGNCVPGFRYFFHHCRLLSGMKKICDRYVFIPQIEVSCFHEVPLLSLLVSLFSFFSIASMLSQATAVRTMKMTLK